MSKSIPNSKSDEIKTGLLIGTLEPTIESKGSWGETYFYKNKFYHCCYSDTQDAWLVFIVTFELEELEAHVDDFEAAKELLAKTEV